MTISLTASPLWLILCALAAVGLAVYSYRQTSPGVAPSARVLLGGMRGMAVFLLLVLLLRPVLVQSETESRDPVLALLVDTSQSMLHMQAENVGTGELRASLRHAAEELERLQPNIEVQLFTFADELRSQPDISTSIDTMSFDGLRTDIGSNLRRVTQQLGNQPVQGIVLVSDGHATAGPNPLQIAEEIPIPIHSVAVGDTVQPDDVYIDRIQSNERAFVDRETPVRVHLSARGLSGEPFEVALFQGDAELDSAPVDAPADGASTSVQLSLTPTQAGYFQYRVETRDLPETAKRDRAAKTFSLRVQDQTRRPLLVAGGPSPTVSEFRHLVSRELGLELQTHVERGDGTFYEGEITTPADSVDLVILAGFPTATTSPAARRAVEEIGSSTPVLFITSERVEASEFGALGEVLPVRPEASTTDWTTEPVRVSPGGAAHAAFTRSPSTATWENLPPARLPVSGWRLRADARPLIMSESGHPVVAVREFAGHRSAAIMAPNSWLWMNLPPTLGAHADLWPNFARDLIQWTSADPADEAIAVTPARSDFMEPEEVVFEAHIREAADTQVEGATVTVNVYGTGGETHTGTLSSHRTGFFEGSLGKLAPGNYEYEASVEHENEIFGGDRGSFSVGAVNPELEFSHANVPLLARLAHRTGGRFVLLDQIQELTNVLREIKPATAVEHEQIRERVLWEWPLLLVIVLGLFSGEWFLRKRYGLP